MPSPPAILLFREIVRTARKLPEKPMKAYYLNIAREKIVAHKEEDDPVRVEKIVERSFADVGWIKKKYGLDISDFHVLPMLAHGHVSKINSLGIICASPSARVRVRHKNSFRRPDAQGRVELVYNWDDD
eukprot:CAMPEP_0114238252 /NCGR_PEP_ID=MMETSP0058-20121206/7826_1 /TAXON_ID=36894 /ORGANISM="Pyramimonas parkeae, CCMP726" /LENGTH=128 /DNA_ID=CAMNT_0001350351 /DNA_START=242 /DNA_END=629 /DNA_ORIENTATION=-